MSYVFYTKKDSDGRFMCQIPSMDQHLSPRRRGDKAQKVHSESAFAVSFRLLSQKHMPGDISQSTDF